MEFQQQHAIITGGSSGIGKATAKLLARRGDRISIVSRSESKLSSAKKEIEKEFLLPSQRIFTRSADVSDRLQAEAAMAGAIAQMGTPDLLVTSAGIAYPGYFSSLPVEIFEQTMAVNYFGSLYCIKAVLPAMRERGKGHIVILSSAAGLLGLYGYSAYCPSKFALRGLAESVRGELKPLGIKISIVYPPDTDTPQLEAESQIRPPETRAIAATAKIWSAESVAREILLGIEQQKFAIAPGLETTVLAKFHSLLAPAINWYFDRLVARERA